MLGLSGFSGVSAFSDSLASLRVAERALWASTNASICDVTLTLLLSALSANASGVGGGTTCSGGVGSRNGVAGGDVAGRAGKAGT